MSWTPRGILTELLLVLAALLLGLVAGMAVAGSFGASPSKVMATMLSSARVYPDMVVEYTAILTLTGLAFAIPLQAGLFNIGAEGCLYAGALTALVASLATRDPITPLLAGSLVGLGLALLAGFLRVRFGVNEVLSTIMINWIVYWVMLYLVVTKLAHPLYPQHTLEVPESARLPWLKVGEVEVPGTIIVAASIAVAYWVFLRLTRYGLFLRVVGANEEAARMRGVPIERYKLLSMALAGVASGLAGALHVVGYSYSIDVLGSSLRGHGFNGIGVALMGRNDPLALVLAAALYSSLLAGGQAVEPLYGVPREASDVILGVIVVLLAMPEAFRIASRILRRGRP